MVYGFLVLCVLWFYDFVVSWFQQFTKFPFHVFQEDIDPISKIFKILFNGSSSVFVARLFQLR